MFKRIITGLAFAIVFLGSIYLGKRYFAILTCAMLALSIFEYNKSTKAHPILWVLSFLTCGVSVWFLSVSSLIYFIVVVLSVLLYMGAILALHGKVDYTKVLANFGFTIYASLCFCLFIGVGSLYGRCAILIPCIFAWINDVFAYFGGYFLGKHKLAPVVSPKKTIEGSISGIVGSVVITIAYAYLVQAIFHHPLVSNLPLLVVLSLICSALAQVGDLVASAIKRDIGVKDYGFILPGHGGIMDRFDSVLYITPIVFLLLKFIK